MKKYINSQLLGIYFDAISIHIPPYKTIKKKQIYRNVEGKNNKIRL